jgi:ABC-type polysaccharide/polyol phosphate transport system ATPase subunit
VSADPRSTAAVSVQEVSKTFLIPHDPAYTLKERVLHPLRRRTHERLDALRSVSFDVASGEFFGIVGRNGSGKSTLLKCMAGIYNAGSGQVLVRGRVGAFIELGVGFAPDLTARDNVLINSVMLGLTPAEARRQLDSIIEFAELEDFVDLKLKNYSSGMQVRLAFAVLVHIAADVMLIDEVLAVGDAAFQQKCIDTLHALKKANRTIVLVTHDMASVERFCDRAVLLERGALVESGDPARVARIYTQVNFDRERAMSHLHEAETRLGDGAVEIVDAWFADSEGRHVTTMEQGTACSFEFRAEVRRDVPAASLGMTLGDETGRVVFVTSTSWRRQVTGALAAGESLCFSVSFENRFAPGRYTATPVVAHDASGQQVMDLRLNLVPVLVTGTHTSGGLVDLPHEVVFRRSGAAVAVEGGK